ncbi:hypothetical protein CUMW_057140 [Citrus unshiu]|nr:hypothetical protein CUMW_057140 [Citrus unshiu]
MAILCDFSIEVFVGICKMEDETLKESRGIAAIGLHRSGVGFVKWRRNPEEMAEGYAAHERIEGFVNWLW